MMVVPVPANWDEEGREAGTRRNRAMLDIALPLGKHGWKLNLEAFPMPESHGTRDMIQLCKQIPRISMHVTELGDASE